MERSPEAAAVGELSGAAARDGGHGREVVERRRPELAGESAGVRRLDKAVAASRAGPHERAEADGEARRQAVRLAPPARGRLPHRGRGRPPRRIRGGRAALIAAPVAVPLRREATVADRAAGAPGRGRRRRGGGGGRVRRLLLLAAARYDPGEPRMFLALLGDVLLMLVLLRSAVVVVVVAEERGEHGELAGAPLLVLVGYVALLERAAAVGGPHLRRPEEEQAGVVPERGVRLPSGHVRRHRPRERRGLWRGRRALLARGRGGRGRAVAVALGREREEAVAEARGADAAAGLVLVLLAPHARRRPVVARLVISSHLISPPAEPPTSAIGGGWGRWWIGWNGMD